MPKKTIRKVLEYESAFRSLLPFLHPVDSDCIQMTLYICPNFDCDTVSPRPGDCKIHKYALMPHIYEEISQRELA